MSSAIEPKNLGDLLKFEEESLYSRDEVSVAAGQTLALGAVVGRNTTSGELAALDPSATDGTESAIGVMAEEVDATTASTQAVMIARHALVARQALEWPADITAEQIAAALTQLESRGVVAREGA
jgi:hypothetical protein